MTRWLELAERRFELRVLGPTAIVFLILAVEAVVRGGDWTLAIALVVASFLAGAIGQSLHKNRNKTTGELAQGPSHEAQQTASELPARDQQLAFARTLVRFGALCAALVAFLAIGGGHSWLFVVAAVLIAWFAAIAAAAIVSLAEIMLTAWRPSNLR
jgi:hypothetical protein